MMLTVALLGLLAGSLHVVAGPDHLAAVAPIVAEGRRRSWLPGLVWGLGHATGVAVVGVLALLLREALPVELLSAWGERLVGVVLIAIGVWGLRRAARHHVHLHRHQHDGETHTHVHVHGEPHPEQSETTHRHSHAAVGVGILHGIAGSSHFFGILPALALPTRLASAVYLLGFAFGTVAAMTGFASLVGLVARRLGEGKRFYPAFVRSLSFLAIVVGGYWLLV